MFKKVAIIGVGLLGGSLGLALRQRRLAREVCGFGRNETRLRTALKLGAIDTATLELGNAVGDADLVLLCSPLNTFEARLKEIAALAPKGCLVTDVGSVKGAWVGRWERAAAPLCFVPSHPMAGSARHGVEAAKACLFEGSACILTPTARTPKAALARVERLWKALGCRTYRLSPARHDQVIGALSHLPHAAAFALVRAVARGLKPADYCLAGKGYRDTTRVGGSDPALWADILLANRTQVLKGIKAYQAELASLAGLLRKGQAAPLARHLEAPAKLRGAL